MGNSLEKKLATSALFLVLIGVGYQNCGGGGITATNPVLTNNPTASGNPFASGSGAPINLGTPGGPLTPGSTPSIRFLGRWDFSDSKGPRSSWSGTSIQANFSGSQLSVSFDATNMADAPYFVAVIDGGKPQRFSGTQGVFTTSLATALPSTGHTVTIWRETEGAQGPWQFLGFNFGAGNLLPPSAAAKLQMEVIGDSITCGYGNSGPIAFPPTCSGNASVNEGNYMAYGSVLARMLGAEISTICYSGIGIYRNYAGQTDSASSPVMGQLYLDTLTSSGTVAEHQYPYTAVAGSSANIVVINLGSNDVGSALAPPPKSNFESGYVDLLKQVRKNNPTASIFLTIGPSLPTSPVDLLSPMQGYLNDVILTMNDPNIFFLPLKVMDPTQGVGCDYHPSPAIDNSMAVQLAPLIAQKLGVTASPADPNPL